MKLLNRNKKKATDPVMLQVPTCYGELTPKQLRYIAALKEYGFSETDLLARCFVKFSGIKPLTGNDTTYFFLKKGYPGIKSMKMEEFSYFIKQMHWIVSDYKGIIPPAYKHITPCDELLADTLFIQYLEAEIHYQRFLRTQDPKDLLMLQATLYQPGSEFNNNNTPVIARKLKHKSKTDRLITLMWMIGIKQVFQKKYPYLFPASPAHDDDDLETEIQFPDMEASIRNQMRMLTKGDVTKENKILNAQTWSALDELNKQCWEFALQEEQMRKLNQK